MEHSEHRKGAFQLSLGFIIGVVFAIVLLSLAVLWIQGLIAGIEDISGDMIQQADQKLSETFQQTDQNYAVWPNSYETPPGKKIAVSAGLKNNAMDGGRHSFLVNVDIQSVPSTVTSTEVEAWMDWAKNSKTVNPNEHTQIPIHISIPHGAKSGTYIFRITGCSECKEPRCPIGGSASSSITTSMCTPNSDYVWGAAAEDFVLIVE